MADDWTMGAFAAQNQYRPVDNPWMPDVGEPAISPGPQISAGVPWANRAADVVSRYVGAQIPGLAQVVGAPGAMMQPNPYPPGSEQADWYDTQRQGATEQWGPSTALNLATIGMPMAEKGAAGVFGGRLSKTADLEALARAEKMDATGAGAHDIWKGTGWFKAADGQWKYEIPDEGSHWKIMPTDLHSPSMLQQTGRQHADPIAFGEAFNHPELFKAYPQLAKADFNAGHLGEGVKGAFVPGDTQLGIDPQILVNPQWGMSGARSTVLHEVQHGIQQIEGFATGGNPAAMKVDVAGTPAWSVYQDLVKRVRTPMTREAFDAQPGFKNALGNKTYEEYLKLHQNAMSDPAKFAKIDEQAKKQAQFETYQRQAGEVEPRNVQTRRDYNALQREQIPLESQDYPNERQFVTMPYTNPQIGGLATPQLSLDEITRPNPIERYVTDPQRILKPGIYKDPRQIAAEANARVAPEHPALKALFGVTRGDLYDISQGGARQGNVAPNIWMPKKPGGSYAAENIMNPANAQRLIDTLTEARKYQGLEHGMVPWYVMDPAYKRLEQLVGPDRAKIEYNNFNSMMTPFSASSDVMKEINRGTGARMFAEQGRFPEFARHAVTPVEERGPNFPPEMAGIIPHPYSAIHTDPVTRYLATGRHGYADKTVKIPLYTQASGVPETGFQTAWPVPDAHFTRAVGMSDVRKNADPGNHMGGPEYRTMAPWFRENVAKPVGIEAVPAQALTWGAYAPQTGVKTTIGAGKLELLSQRIWERAQELGVDPSWFRDRVLLGKEHAELDDNRGMGSLAAQNKYV